MKKPSEILSRGAIGEIVAPLTLPPELAQLAEEWSTLTYEQKIADVRKRPLEDCVRLLASLGGICKNAIRVVREFRPLIDVCRDELSQPGCRVPVAGKPTWTKFVPETFGFTARRMQQLLADGKPRSCNPSIRAFPKKTRVSAYPDDHIEKQVAILALSLARGVVEHGLADKFPEAAEILRIVDSKGKERPSKRGGLANGQQVRRSQEISPEPTPNSTVPLKPITKPERCCGREFQPQPGCFICGTGINTCAMHEPMLRAKMDEYGIDDHDASLLLRDEFDRAGIDLAYISAR